MTLLSTLGFTPDKLLPAVVAQGGVRKLIIYYAPGETAAKEKKAQDALTYVLERLEGTRLRIERVRLPHPWRVPEMIGRMLEDIRREGPRNCVFNLTGGTKVMAVAATLVCVVTGTRALYVPEESEDPEPLDLPLPPLLLQPVLTPQRARVLRSLAGRDYPSQAELARALRMAESTVFHHLARLRAVGAVGTARQEGGPRVTPRITDTGRLLLLLRESLGPVQSRSRR